MDAGQGFSITTPGNLPTQACTRCITFVYCSSGQIDQLGRQQRVAVVGRTTGAVVIDSLGKIATDVGTVAALQWRLGCPWPNGEKPRFLSRGTCSSISSVHGKLSLESMHSTCSRLLIL